MYTTGRNYLWEIVTSRKEKQHYFRLRVACVAWRFWLGALSNKGGRGQRNREEIGAEVTWSNFSRGFAARSRALHARISRLRRSCARLDKTAMLRRLVSELSKVALFLFHSQAWRFLSWFSWILKLQGGFSLSKKCSDEIFFRQGQWHDYNQLDKRVIFEYFLLKVWMIGR